MRSIVHLLCAASALLAAACAAPAPATTPGNQPAASGARQASSPAPKGVYDDPTWQELIAAARQEGKLVVASGPNPDMRVQLPAAFKDRFGIEIEYLGGRSSDLQTRLRGERASGVSSVDVIIGGGDSVTAMYNDGWFAPIRPLLVVPQVQDQTAFLNNRYPFLDPQDAYMFELEATVLGYLTVNPDLVSDSDLQKLDDLLEPRWKGKLSVDDPTVPGQGQNNAIYLYVLKGDEYFKRLFADQQPGVSRDPRQLQDWLARGIYPVSFGLAQRDVDDMRQQGLPAKVIGQLDGPGAIVGGFGVLCLFTDPPHPNAAKLFVNWLASPDGMGVHAQAEAQVPLRKDVAHPWATEFQVPKEGVSYQDLYDYHYIMDQKPAIIRRIREVMGQ
ncbi:MAG TPA: extracellular solute-binding protein [Chloroflexota bacterium]|nr:extracellular solute-binding protein [Chloroflexota bacterium]